MAFFNCEWGRITMARSSRDAAGIKYLTHDERDSLSTAFQWCTMVAFRQRVFVDFSQHPEEFSGLKLALLPSYSSNRNTTGR